jgi:hypothetical protein
MNQGSIGQPCDECEQLLRSMKPLLVQTEVVEPSVKFFLQFDATGHRRYNPERYGRTRRQLSQTFLGIIGCPYLDPVQASSLDEIHPALRRAGLFLRRPRDPGRGKLLGTNDHFFATIVADPRCCRLVWRERAESPLRFPTFDTRICCRELVESLLHEVPSFGFGENMAVVNKKASTASGAVAFPLGWLIEDSSTRWAKRISHTIPSQAKRGRKCKLHRCRLLD